MGRKCIKTRESHQVERWIDEMEMAMGRGWEREREKESATG